jgi:hypothetical protein
MRLLVAQNLLLLDGLLDLGLLSLELYLSLVCEMCCLLLEFSGLYVALRKGDYFSADHLLIHTNFSDYLNGWVFTPYWSMVSRPMKNLLCLSMQHWLLYDRLRGVLVLFLSDLCFLGCGPARPLLVISLNRLGDCSFFLHGNGLSGHNDLLAAIRWAAVRQSLEVLNHHVVMI